MTITIEGVSLQSDLFTWVDEYKWSPVKQSVNLSLNGKQIIQEAAQVKGRPITLSGEDAWATKATLEQLRVLEETPNLDMALDYHGTNYTVRFNRTNGSPIEAEQVAGFSNPQNDAYYRLTLRLITV